MKNYPICKKFKKFCVKLASIGAKSLAASNKLCKQFGPRSGPMSVTSYLDPNCFTLMVFPKKFVGKNINFAKKKKKKKKLADDKTACKEFSCFC